MLIYQAYNLRDEARDKPAGVMFHSDRGSHYTSRRLAMAVSTTGSALSSANANVKLSSSKITRLLIKNLMLTLLGRLVARIITEA